MAIEPSSVDWSAARRASYLVRQTFRYEYPEPIRDLSHRLVVIPPERFGDQRRLWHDVSVGLDGARLENRFDRFGNVIFDIFAPQVVDSIEFVAEVSVERRRAEPNRLADGWLAFCRSGWSPSRDVSGNLLGHGGTHAWVEVILPAGDGTGDAIAHAFDPTHASRGGLGHVTVAVGADYSDVAPTSVTYVSGARGRLTATKRVSLVEIG